jgi:membrane-associated phospholipid phosphatase
VTNQDHALPLPGWKDGLFYHLLVDAHNAGERPTAAFPSSHVGITTVVLWLAHEARSRRLLYSMLPLGVLMFFATFYIQAHYAIDAIAGLVVGTLMYFFFRWAYRE